MSTPTIASQILATVAEFRRKGTLDSSLCWPADELELLAMYAMAAKNDLARLAAADPALHEGPWKVQQIRGHFSGRMLDWAIHRGMPGDRDYFVTTMPSEAEALAVRDALNRVARERPEGEKP